MQFEIQCKSTFCYMHWGAESETVKWAVDAPAMVWFEWESSPECLHEEWIGSPTKPRRQPIY